MIPSPSIDVSCHPRDRFHIDEDQSILALLDMMQGYRRALERLDQRFANLGDWKKSPDVAHMPREKLLKRAQKRRRLGFDFDNRTIKERRDVSINFGHPSNRISSRATIRLDHCHPMMREEARLSDVLQLGIEFWRGDDAGIYYLSITGRRSVAGHSGFAGSVTASKRRALTSNPPARRTAPSPGLAARSEPGRNTRPGCCWTRSSARPFSTAEKALNINPAC